MVKTAPKQVEIRAATCERRNCKLTAAIELIKSIEPVTNNYQNLFFCLNIMQQIVSFLPSSQIFECEIHVFEELEKAFQYLCSSFAKPSIFRDPTYNSHANMVLENLFVVALPYGVKGFENLILVSTHRRIAYEIPIPVGIIHLYFYTFDNKQINDIA
jgi:hypothetical protein